MIFYPLIITIGIVFKSFLVDLRQIPQTSLVLLGLLAVLTTFLQILQRIIHLSIFHLFVFVSLLMSIPEKDNIFFFISSHFDSSFLIPLKCHDNDNYNLLTLLSSTRHFCRTYSGEYCFYAQTNYHTHIFDRSFRFLIVFCY